MSFLVEISVTRPSLTTSMTQRMDCATLRVLSFVDSPAIIFFLLIRLFSRLIPFFSHQAITLQTAYSAYFCAFEAFAAFAA